MVFYLEEVVLGWWVSWRGYFWVGGLPGGGSPGLLGYLEEVVLGWWVTWWR